MSVAILCQSFEYELENPLSPCRAVMAEQGAGALEGVFTTNAVEWARRRRSAEPQDVS